MKQNVRFRKGYPLKNYQLYQIRNGRLSARQTAVINFNMPDILQTVLYSLNITMK